MSLLAIMQILDLGKKRLFRRHETVYLDLAAYISSQINEHIQRKRKLFFVKELNLFVRFLIIAELALRLSNSMSISAKCSL